MSRGVAEIAERVDLTQVTHATELGPYFVDRLRGEQETGFYGSQDDANLRKEWAEGEGAAAILVGDKVRFLGPWLHDSPILEISRSRSSFDLVVSDDWTTCLAHAYARRVGRGKVLRCNPIMPVRFHFTGVKHLSGYSIDYEDNARMHQEDVGGILDCAEEYLSTQVISVSEAHIQMALTVSLSWRRRWSIRGMLILIEAERLRIYDRRRKAWRRTFGSESLQVLEEGDRVWVKDPMSIIGDTRLDAFLDSMGVPERKEVVSCRPIKYKSRFRRR